MPCGNKKSAGSREGNQHLGVLFFGYCRAVGAACESIEFVAGEVVPVALGEVGALYGLSAAGG